MAQLFCEEKASTQTFHRALNTLLVKNIINSKYTFFVIQKQPPGEFSKKRVLKNFAKFTGKHLRRSLFFNKVAGLRLQYCKIFKKTFLTEHLWTITSVYKQLGSGPSPHSCLYFQNFQGSNWLNGCLIV